MLKDARSHTGSGWQLRQPSSPLPSLLFSQCLRSIWCRCCVCFFRGCHFVLILTVTSQWRSLFPVSWKGIWVSGRIRNWPRPQTSVSNGTMGFTRRLFCHPCHYWSWDFEHGDGVNIWGEGRPGFKSWFYCVVTWWSQLRHPVGASAFSFVRNWPLTSNATRHQKEYSLTTKETTVVPPVSPLTACHQVTSMRVISFINLNSLVYKNGHYKWWETSPLNLSGFHTFRC